MKSIKDLRTDYQKSVLNIEDLTEDPITLFQQWLSQAITYSNDANAFVLSTVNSNGVPSSRVLLLRGITEKGFSFFTNYSSSKSESMVQLVDCLYRNRMTISIAALMKVG